MSDAAAASLPDVVRTSVGALVRLTPRDSLNTPEMVDALRESVVGCVASRHGKIIVDLSNVAQINSAGIEAMLDIQDQLLRLGGWLKYSQASPLLLEVFEVCGVVRYINAVDAQASSPEPRKAGPQARGRLGEILVERGLLTEEQVAEAAGLQQRSGMRIGHIVVDKG